MSRLTYLAAIALASSLAPGAPLRAQMPQAGTADTTGTSPAEAPALVTAANAARLEPGKWTYVARLMGSSAPSRLGFRTLELRDTTYRGAPAWMLVDSRQLATVTLGDTLYLAKSDLTPLRRVMHTPGSDVTTEFARDSIRATFSGETGDGYAALAEVPGVLANLYLLERLVAVSPVGPTWKGSASLAALGRDESGIVPLVMRTTGEESLLVPDGRFDCWIVTLDVGRGSQRMWVRKSDGVMLKERIPVVGMANAELELLLAEHGVSR
ncbi:MAG TPA: hypothetical protein VF041_20145 [Gemmatimonadaceae bacterium]